MLTRLSLSSFIGLLIQFLLRLVLYSLLSLSNSINHLDHILTYNLSDDDDICAISEDVPQGQLLIAHFLLLWPLCKDESVFKFLPPSMALPFGDLHNLNLEPSKCHLIISFGRFGLFPTIATLVLFTLSQDLRVFIILLLLVPEIFLHLLEDPVLL